MFIIEYMPDQYVMRTFHYYFHVIDQTMNYIESLGNGQFGLFEGESIQTLKNCFDVVLPQELSCIFLCNQSRNERSPERTPRLTQSPLVDLFCRQSKNDQ